MRGGEGGQAAMSTKLSGSTDKLTAVLNGPSVVCRNNPPDGGNLRQTVSQTKPWEALGISRATWYRQGKPTCESELSGSYYHRQKNQASSENCSLRTVQRTSFVARYGIPDLGMLANHRVFPAAMLEEVAKWDHNAQRCFLNRVLELAAPDPVVPDHWKDALNDCPIATRLVCHLASGSRDQDPGSRDSRDIYDRAKRDMRRLGKQAFDEVYAAIVRGEL
jgi:hypothetical protein